MALLEVEPPAQSEVQSSLDQVLRLDISGLCSMASTMTRLPVPVCDTTTTHPNSIERSGSEQAHSKRNGFLVVKDGF